MKPGQLIPLGPGVALIPGHGKGRFPHCHALLVQGKNATAIIDPGCGTDILEPLARRVDLVLNTHTHADHAAGNWLWNGREILVPEYSFASGGGMAELAKRYVKTDSQVRGWIKAARQRADMRDFRPTGFFAPGQKIDVGGIELIPLATPGHTADHTAFYLPALGLVYSGDIELSRFGPWYANPESEPSDFRASIRLVMELGPRVVAPSHQPPVMEDTAAALAAYLGVIDRREADLLAALAEPRTWPEIISLGLIYGPRVNEIRLLHYFERQMIGKHLDELLEQGRVTCDDGIFRAE